MTPINPQQSLDLNGFPVQDYDESAPWPMPPGGPIRWPSPRETLVDKLRKLQGRMVDKAVFLQGRAVGCFASTGSAIAGALLGMVRS